MTDTNRELTKRSIKAGAWLSSYKIFAKVIGLIKTSITARILTPSQFGIFGFVSISLNLFETFSETGIEQALIQEKIIKPSHLAAGWIVIILRSLLISLLLFATAPLISKFFDIAELTLFIKLIAITPIIRSLRNPQLILNKKKLKFLPESLMLASGTLTEVIAAIFLALATRSVSALVFSIILGALAELIASYTVLPLPTLAKPDWKFIPKLLHFGKWVWSSSLLSYLVNQGDDIIVGKVLGTSALGLYQNAFKLASLPATEIAGTISQVMFPALALIKTDLYRLKRGIKKTLLVNLIGTFPFLLGLFLFAKPIVLVIYGQQWLSMVPALRVLVIFGALRSLNTNVESLVVALGKPRLLAMASLIRTVVLGISLYGLTVYFNIVGAAFATVLAISIASIYLIMKLIPLVSSGLLADKMTQ